MPYTPRDTYFRFQTYLSGRYDLGPHSPNGMTPWLNVQDVWDDYRGRGVNVAVFGYPDADHWDLRANYNFAGRPTLNPPNAHLSSNGLATALAGTIAADDNGRGLVGVAPDSRVAGYGQFMGNGIRLLDADVVVARTDTVRFGATHLDAAAVTAGRDGKGSVVVLENAPGNSISINLDGSQFGNAGSRHAVVVNALSVEGVIGYGSMENEMTLTSVLADTASYIHGSTGVITDPWDPNKWQFDPSIWSNANDAIATLVLDDLGAIGRVGANSGSFGLLPPLINRLYGTPITDLNSGAMTTTFNSGQESAIVAGVVALMLEANPNLGWRDVQTILSHASVWHKGRGIAPDLTGALDYIERQSVNNATTHNGGGFAFSRDLGFGTLDAFQAVRLAETWRGTQSSQNEVNLSVGGGTNIGRRIQVHDNGALTGPEPVVARLNLNIARDIDIESLDLRLDLHVLQRVEEVWGTFWGGLAAAIDVTLISPDGTRWHVRQGGGSDATDIVHGTPPGPNATQAQLNAYWGDFDGSWSTRRFAGESAQGQWQIELRSRAEQPGLMDILVQALRLTVHGAGETSADTYVFNDDFRRTNRGADGTINLGNDRVIRDWQGDNIVNASAMGDETLVLHARGGSTSTADGARLYSLGAATRISTLIASDGHDRLHSAGTHGTRMEGGRGNDTYYVSHSMDQVIERAGHGRDAVFIGTNFSLGRIQGPVEIVKMVGAGNWALYGTARSEVLEGNAGNNALHGGAGHDTLIGRAGRDTMVGGLGNDIYITDGRDLIVEKVGEGIDTVQSWASLNLPRNIENIVLLGTANISATGNAMDNRITGNAGNNWLTGGGGRDTMIGGRGNDTYLTDGNDIIIEGAGGGFDTVRSSGSFRLPAHVENLILTGAANTTATGNAMSNFIAGNSGNNWLNGLGGNDTLRGGAGADHFVFGAGRTLVADFQNNIDTLHINNDLWGGRALTPQQVLAQFGEIQNGRAVLDFGHGNVLTVNGVNSLNILIDDLVVF
ncbi:S8 family serine peptidase [Paracoccus sulfuroxidans]|uniref:Ca2+-binding RTX toxin-like protein n=1 Tax=Paracoccus sulfuroxidans TaxID=384678 RepID=A0A562NUL3_9RHOB|nr:S8 family serine peptidase [Paracoccus sulfuroxidans]TWI35882.1 Ca2+-binding RTX toxin-like protein [Paracoccus sulfuroxidans]